MRRLLCCLLLPLSVFAADPVTLHWLGDLAPAAPVGVSWGVPWPQGAVQPATPMRLTTASGTRLGVQTWPVAYWPDGSVKWTGHALAASQDESVGQINAGKWDFGEGESSPEQHPQHTDKKSDTFIVVLHATGPDGTSRRAKIGDVALR